MKWKSYNYNPFDHKRLKKPAERLNDHKTKANNNNANNI